MLRQPPSWSSQHIICIGLKYSTACQAADNFVESSSAIASSFSETFQNWNDSHDAQLAKQTFVRFAIHRDEQLCLPEDICKQLCEPLLTALNLMFGSTLGLVTGPTMDLSLNWDICWADEEGNCPACQPETCHPAYRTDAICNKDTRLQYENTTIDENA
jgi:hypothetical protein